MELTILFPYWSGKTCDLDKSIFAPDFSNSPDKFIWAHPCSAMVGRAIALRWPLFSVGRDGALRRPRRVAAAQSGAPSVTGRFVGVVHARSARSARAGPSQRDGPTLRCAAEHGADGAARRPC